MSFRKRLIYLTGWIATIQGHGQWIMGLVFLFLPFTSQKQFDLQTLQLTLIFLLLGLILLLIGYLFRHPRKKWMKSLFLFIVLYIPVGFAQTYLLEQLVFDDVDFFSLWLSGWNPVLLVGWPIWLTFVLLLYFVPRALPDQSNRIETTRGRYNVIWLLITFTIIGVVMRLAGSPMAFLEPVAILAIVVTLPFVLLLSGMAPSELPAFFGGLIWIKFIPANRVEDYRYFSRRAGRFVVLMGALTSLIGLVVMMGNLDNPDMLGPSMAVSLLSLLYGLAMKLLLFDPYCSILRLVEEADTDD